MGNHFALRQDNGHLTHLAKGIVPHSFCKVKMGVKTALVYRKRIKGHRVGFF